MLSSWCSKTAPRILIFSIAIGANYSFELNSIETYAPQFFGHNNLFLGSVSSEAASRLPRRNEFSKSSIFDVQKCNVHQKILRSYSILILNLCVECFSQLSFDSEMYTKLAAVADFVYTSESNESCVKYLTQR